MITASTQIGMRRWGLSLASTLLVLAAAPAAQATPCSQLQAAIDAAPASGGTVAVDAGSVCALDAPLTWTAKAVTLAGSGTGAVLLAPADDRILELADAGASVIANLTLRDARLPKGSGGAVTVTGNSLPTFDRIRLLDNAAGTLPTDSGGAISVETTATGGTVRILDSALGDGTQANANAAPSGGAVAISAMAGASVEVLRSSFTANRATTAGGALAISTGGPGGRVRLADNAFTANRLAADAAHAVHGAGVAISSTGATPVTVTGNTFSQNTIDAGAQATAGLGAGLHLQGEQSTLASLANTYHANTVTAAPDHDLLARGGGLDSHSAAFSSRDDRFTANTLAATSAQGAGLNVETCPAETAAGPRIDNAIVAANQASGPGRGAGAAVSCDTGPVALSVANTTIAGNAATGDTAGLWGGSDDTLTMVNSVVAANRGGLELAGFDAERAISYSDACAADRPQPGTGNICADPKLAGASTGDVRQRTGSPLVDAGLNSAVPVGLTHDAYGLARITDGNANAASTVDIGAAESAGRPPVPVAASPPATGSRPRTPPPDRRAPVLSALGVAHRSFTVVKARGKIAAGLRAPSGTRFTFLLSEAASVRVRITPRISGRRAAPSCRALPRRPARPTRCTRSTRSGTLRFAGTRGINTIAFTGRVGGRRLAGGRYRASFGAMDATGNASVARTLTFTIVER